MKSILTELKDIVRSAGIVTDFDYMRNKGHRRRLHQKCPHAFLGKHGNIPTFPTTDQTGAYSIPVIRMSIISARRMHANKNLPNERYEEIFSKLNQLVDDIKNKKIRTPVQYDASDNIIKILKNTKPV